VSDHGIDYPVNTAWDDDSADRVFRKARDGEAPAEEEIRLIRTAVMETCARMDAAAGWVMQIHMGALRSVNSRRYAELGPDTGFDVIGDWRVAGNLAGFLDRLERDGELPKMILYSVNAADNDVIAAMIGAFQGGTPGKMQFGSGWWHHDQKDGMEKQMTSLANLGLLSHFVGMLTDSRSFLSFPRHEYFRRILCNLVGGWVENGEAPDDREIIDGLIADICYRNARRYFAFDEGKSAD
jgi:glucuronate isomerase